MFIMLAYFLRHCASFSYRKSRKGFSQKAQRKLQKWASKANFIPALTLFFIEKNFLGRCIVKVRKQVKDIAIGWPDAAIRAGEKPYSPVKKWA